MADNTTIRFQPDFPPVSRQEWEDKIKQDLKRDDFLSKLSWKTLEGIEVKPFYRYDDIENLPHLSAHPGEFPYVRGFQKEGNEWLVRQDIEANDLNQANEKALDVLMKGVDSLGFVLNPDHSYTRDDLDQLLHNIYCESIELNFLNNNHPNTLLLALQSLLQNRGQKSEVIHGSIDYDPIGEYVLKGVFPHQSEDNAFSHVKELINLVRSMPSYKVVNLHGNHFHNAGASVVEELAFTLASAAEYFSRLTELEVSAEDLTRRIKIQLAAGPNYFMEIAKFRAIRMLWANLAKAFQVQDEIAQQIHIHASTSHWDKTLYDPNVNMLRTTTEAMSALIGGADSLTVEAFDFLYEKPTPFAERVARNQQIVLKEEAYMNKVADPSAGAYYIEYLTNSLAENAWKLFQEIEQEGGFIKAFQNGSIQNYIKNTAAQRNQAIAKRKNVFVGTNQYPDFAEKYTRDIDPRVIEPTDLTDPLASVETLKPYRGPQAFEQLRLRTDHYAKTNPAPKVFMLTYGNPAMRTARAQFSANFFAVAGFEIINNLGFDSVEKGVEEAVNCDADILVLCSSDDQYSNIAPKAYELAGDKMIVVIAGYPKDSIEMLQAKGIRHFIHMRSNILESLTSFQKELGILPES